MNEVKLIQSMSNSFNSKLNTAAYILDFPHYLDSVKGKPAWTGWNTWPCSGTPRARIHIFTSM